MQIVTVEKNFNVTIIDEKEDGHRKPGSITLNAGSLLLDALGMTVTGSGGLEAFVPGRWLEIDNIPNDAGGGDPRESPLRNPQSHTCAKAVDANIEVCAIVAGLLAIWDVHPLHSQDLEIPKPLTSSPISRPRTECRVLLSQRTLSD